MSTVARFVHIDKDRYRAVKDQVRASCTRLKLCPEATQRAIDRAAKVLREGRSAGIAISEGISFAKRLVRFGDAGFGPRGDAA